MSGSDISDLARISYEAGIDPVDYAECEIETLIKAHARIAASRAAAPDVFPAYPIDLTIAALVRRILGNLLDAGWQPPVWPIPEPGCGRSHG